MCGIGGIIMHRASALDADSVIASLDDAVHHRGPDGHGSFASPSRLVHLVHRRLSIIDHAGGSQPMRSEAPAAAVVFNGCLYNHRDLRTHLQSLGERFTSDHSDTEVVLRAITRWGSAAFDRFEGMFAIAHWTIDANGRESLLLARDRCGEKPLYALELDGAVAFSSSAAALMSLGADRPRSAEAASRDAASAARWLAWGHSTLPLRGVTELPPGTWMRCSPGAAPQRGDFSHAPATLPADSSEPLTATRVTALLRNAVRSRLESDVPLGCFLSGGIDSSLVAAFGKEALGELRTFCVAMPAGATDESPHAAAVAKHLGTRHETLPCSANAAADLVSLIDELGLPFGDSSILPSMWVSRAARRHVTVALSGDGGDELFRGYRRHVAASALRRFRTPLRVAAGLAGPWLDRLGVAGRLLDAARGIGYPQISAIFSPAALEALIGPEHSRACFHSAFDQWRAAGIDDAPWWDFSVYLPGDLMRKVDAASMHVALEVRSPMLDTALIRACLGSPEGVLMPEGRRKGLLRDVAATFLPTEIVNRPKQGFSVPLAAWFRDDFGGLRTLLGDTLTGTDPFPENMLGLSVNRRWVNGMVDEHLRLGRDHSQRLFSLLTLSLWSRRLAANLRR